VAHISNPLSQADRFSPAALAFAVLLHAAMAAGYGGCRRSGRSSQLEDVIEVTVDRGGSPPAAQAAAEPEPPQQAPQTLAIPQPEPPAPPPERPKPEPPQVASPSSSRPCRSPPRPEPPRRTVEQSCRLPKPPPAADGDDFPKPRRAPPPPPKAQPPAAAAPPPAAAPRPPAAEQAAGLRPRRSAILPT
jgi:hypothetical protein